MSSLLLGCGLPGGMMGSMMADLAGVREAINANRQKKGEEPLSEDALLVKLFDEVAYVWPRVGYPPLVTPFSQYVKNIALMNLLTESMDKPRYSMMDNAIWGMILGKSGKLPGELAPEIVALAKEKGYEFSTEDPQTNYPDELDRFIKEMEESVATPKVSSPSSLSSEKSITRAISSATSRTASARFWKSPQHWAANWWKSMLNRVATCRRAM